MPIENVRELFVPNRIARLMTMEENEQTRYQYEVWFEYTRQTMTEVREGTLLAVRNFATSQDATHYSVLEIVSIKPVHYALGEAPSGYPGFVMEAARNVATDWTSQEECSEEDTTIIRCNAIPTGLQITQTRDGTSVATDQALPMIGSDARVLTSEATQEIVNREITPASDWVFGAGTWLVDSRVPIFALIEDFLRLHFGVFGFTGAGKSNLVSTYTSSILDMSRERNHPAKIVLFDLMGEYTALLIDQILVTPGASVLAIGEETLPGAVVDFLVGDQSQRQTAVAHLLGSTLFPRPLERVRNRFLNAFDRLLRERKIRVRREPLNTFDDFLRRRVHALVGVQTEGRINPCRDIISQLEGLRNRPFNEQTVAAAIAVIDGQPQASRQEVRAAIEGFRQDLEEARESVRRQFPADAVMSLNEMIQNLNDRSSASLFVVQAHDGDELREFAFELGWQLYETRRRRGIIQPLVSFVFDEADEFIPGEYKEDSSYGRSARIVETLARRGRKFGIGVGICTQRVRRLRVSVMAQPHTYMISKMPRIEDRVAIQEAFGLSEEMFRQTFKFAPGDWLLISHDATGLKAAPIPIHVPNANDRVAEFVANPTAAVQPQRS